MQTYWLELKGGRHSAHGSSHGDSSTNPLLKEDELYEISRDGSTGYVNPSKTNKIDRLIDWNVEILSNTIKQIVANRRANGLPDFRKAFDAKVALTHGGTVLDEVKEIIALPEFDEDATHGNDHEAVELSDDVMAQLSEYVRCIAMLYKENPFHNFEHASHVVMSSIKLLGRIVAPSDIEPDMDGESNLASTLHHHTYVLIQAKSVIAI